MIQRIFYVVISIICIIYMSACGNNDEILQTDTKKMEDADNNEVSGKKYVYTKEFNGILMEVVLDDEEVEPGSKITGSAKVKNNTDKTITLYTSAMGYEVNLFLRVSMEKGEDKLIDADTDLTGFDAAIDTLVLKPGEESIKTLNFETNVLDSETDDGKRAATAGVYRGISGILYYDTAECTNISDVSEYLKACEVEFQVTLK